MLMYTIHSQIENMNQEQSASSMVTTRTETTHGPNLVTCHVHGLTSSRWRECFHVLMPSFCVVFCSLGVLIVSSLTLSSPFSPWQPVLSSVVKTHAACSRSPHNALHSPNSACSGSEFNTDMKTYLIGHHRQRFS